ncbi:chemotaxis protein CheA [Salinisphaera sp. T31B1]|uniref:chemotaxis protein CheA n=1 Tax=Salinisphaera sp. T31B1 TaxID=727963 RepID=UPI0033414B60
MDISEFYQTFFDEADELLDDMERLLLALDPAAPADEDLNAIFRAAHSIKGGAGTFGFEPLQDTTHRLENLLDSARHHELVLDQAIVDVFLETRDILKAQVAAYREQAEPDAEACRRIGATLATLADTTGGQAAVSAAPPAASAAIDAECTEAPALRIDIRGRAPGEHDALVEELALFGDVLTREIDGETLVVRLRSTVSAADITSVLCFVVDADQLTIVADDDEAAGGAPSGCSNGVAADRAPGANAGGRTNLEAAAAQTRSAAAESTSLRVATDKVDRIINLVGELVITQSMIEQATAGLHADVAAELAEGMAQLQRNARDLQEAVMSVRMTPMDYVFSRFPRLVRDLGRKLGKEVELATVGASTELDKGLIERIMDPLTHLVRNSLDHGIEAPAAREAAGKPRAGTLTLAARHQGANVLIEIRDDGAGLNRDRLLAKARENGLAVDDAMADDEVWQLIFAPGFSTAQAVTDVSGRGVGMDVVKRNIQQLGGHVDLISEPGIGITVRIVLPLTLAIMDSMSIRVGGEVFIMPLGAIVESIQVRTEQVRPVAGGGRVIEVRGQYLALVELHRVFDVPAARTDLSRGIVMVVQSEGRPFALFVDELIGQQQVVVKNLETHYRKVPGVSAATILGDGSVALILDVLALSRLARRPPPCVPAPSVTIEQETVS